MLLQEILDNSNYRLDLFDSDSIRALESRIIIKTSKITKSSGVKSISNSKDLKDTNNLENLDSKKEYYTTCLVRDKEVKLNPEEVVRQLYLDKLINEYKYTKDRIKVEISLQKGADKGDKEAKKDKKEDILIIDSKSEIKEKKRIDILVLDPNNSPYIIIEVKKPEEKEGYEQLQSYIRWANAPLGVLCNGNSVEEFYYNKEDKSYKTTKLEKLSAIPKANETLKHFLNAKYTLKNLFINDELQTKTLKKIIKEFEDVILANSGVDSFEEIFKLIFIKLFDEYKSSDDFRRIDDYIDGENFNNYKEFVEFIKKLDDTKPKFRHLDFRAKRDDENILDFRKRIDNLFIEAKEQWQGIFDKDSIFKLTNEELNISVSYLQNIKLFNSNFEVIDDAFEYLVVKSQKGDKGQYFTPRYVIDMCVKMLNPKANESIIDTASGSCGFPMHCILYVWSKLNPKRKNLLSAIKKTAQEEAYVKNVFAIDFDEKSVRIGRLLNKIAGDGETNVLHLNSLHYKEWKNDAKVANWEDFYKKGFENFEKLCSDSKTYSEKYAKDYSHFNFDIVMANPPFAGDITNANLYSSYELGKKKISRDILFIERNLNMLRPGGRMAIVLPQGRFNNSSDKYIREFIASRARILAVIGLHGNVFKPHTGTKTSVLFLQKWGGEDENGRELCPKKEDYNIFFATMSEPSKDNSGDKIYLKNANNEFILDSHGHKIVRHDLFNHDKLTQDGIAEAFIDFAKSENLSFWRDI